MDLRPITPDIDTARRRRHRSLGLLAVAMVLLTVTVDGHAVPGAGGSTAGAEATAPTVLAAALEHVSGGTPTPAVAGPLEGLIEEALRVEALAHGPLTVIAGGDPVSVEPFLACHLRQERIRWSDVGPVWTRALERTRTTLGAALGDCSPGDATPCGLLVRLRLQTIAGAELATEPSCDGDCVRRLEQVRDRLERTMATVVDVGDGAPGSDLDVPLLLEEAQRARDDLTARIRIARQEGADPGAEVCPADPTQARRTTRIDDGGRP